MLFGQFTYAQHILQPGFDAKEYVSLFSLSRYHSSIPDSAQRAVTKDPYQLVYRSPEMGLKNQWTFHVKDNRIGVISIRGTVADKISWLENYYFAMIPTVGSLNINDSTVFNYKLAASKDAAVHTGWTLGLAFMAPDIENKILEYYHKGVKDFYIFGHSQGGAIAFLLRSYLFYRQQSGNIPYDIIFKTYNSAAPKPGNMQYAYDYDFINRGGWAFTVLNAADWVPESPYSLQTLHDMNASNPLIHANESLQTQKFLLRLAGKYYLHRVSKKPERLQKMYTRYFGEKMYKMAISKALPGFQMPAYYPSVNYMRAGNPIVLMPDSAYYEKFNYQPEKKNYFVHHSFEAYYYLVKKYYY